MVSRRIASLLLACSVLMTAGAGRALAADSSFLIHSPRNLSFAPSGDGDGIAVTDAGWALSSEPGTPALPYRIVQILLPQGETVESTTFEPGPEHVVRNGVSSVVPSDYQASDGGHAGGSGLFSTAGLSQTRGRYLGTGWLHGYAVASVLVLPYDIRDGVLYGVDDVRVTLHTRPADIEPVVRERHRDGFRQIVENRLHAMVINPQMTAQYSMVETVVSDPPGGFAPSTFPSLEGSPVDYVIITPDAQAATYQTLADWKTEKGVPTVVRTVEWINANYRHGSDDAETIRNFVKDAYAKWGVTYVLLGGDTDQIPVRTGYSTYYDGGKDLPADMYFGCLDGDWNSDHDAVFGEFSDTPDFYAEVYVGRLPTRSAAEAAVMVGKVIAYETPVDVSYGKKILMLAEVLSPANYHPGDPITSNGGDIAEFIRLSYMTSPSLSVVRKYESYTLYPGSFPETRVCSIDSIDGGYNHVVHVGHGFRFNMSVGDASIQDADADAFTNSTRLSNFNMLNCTACAYTYESLAEHMLRNPGGGAVSVVGSNDGAFASVALYYMSEFYRLVFNQNVHLGEAFARSREARTPLALASDGVDRWTHLVYTLLGDPEMPMWTDAAKPLTVSFPASVNKGTNSIAVTVMDNGSPVDSAVVCLSKDADDYKVGTTNASGQVTMSFRAESAGSIKVVVTGQNYRRYTGSITVGGTGAYVAFSSMTVDDNTSGGTSGNNDGIIDGGETIDVFPTMMNTGTASTGTVSLTLRSTDAGVTITDSTASVGTITAGGSKAATDKLRIVFNSNITDGQAVPFTLIIKNNGIETWRDTFKKEVHEPKLALVRLHIDDTATGNGNGVVDAGEQFKLYYRVKNFGTGGYRSGNVSVSDLDGAFSFVNTTDTYGTIASLAERENTSGITMSESSVGTEHRLRFSVTDFYGRAYVDTVEFRAPMPPTSILIDPSLGPNQLKLTWTASPSTDVAYYNVYQSLSSGGPFTVANVDPVAHTVFVDEGLNSTTKYYFKATAIDVSGNESLASPVYSGSTNPAQLTGWPIAMDLETTSSPAVGDIDGDGVPEIVVGDKYIYAWHANGDEMVDGDGQPVTWGILNTQGQSFVSHVALARIDGQPRLDIVALSRDTKQAFVFDYTGATLPGWPQPLENTIRAGATVGDLDGDGVLEIVAIDELGVIYAWKNNGAEFIDGDSNPLTPGVFKRLSGSTFQYSTPALADIDNDGKDEIIVGTEANQLYAFNGDGSNVPGFPVALSDDIAGSPAVGDVDGNGSLDIVVNVHNGNVRAITNTGANLWTRTLVNGNFFGPSPALADVDGDGKLETFIPASNGKLYVLTYTGADRPGFPVTYSTLTYTESSPVVADIDGDGLLDVVLGTEEKTIWGWNRNGVPLDGFPLTTGDAMRGVPTITDVDGDGDVDLVAAGWDKNVYVWDFAGTWDPNKAPWPRFHGNLHNNGRYGYTVSTPVRGATFRYTAGGRGVELVWGVPPEAGRVFTVTRAEVVNGAPGSFVRVASGVSLGTDGLLRVTDGKVEMGSRYVYRLEGESGLVDETLAVVVPVSMAKLGQNYPNPFNPTTTIEYWVPGGSGKTAVSVVIYDVRGARVRTLVEGAEPAGRYTATWDGRTDAGAPASSGIYFYRMAAGTFAETKKMVLLK